MKFNLLALVCVLSVAVGALVISIPTNSANQQTQVHAQTGTAPVITTTSLPSGTVGSNYSSTFAVLQASGSTPLTWSVPNEDLPNGLNLHSLSNWITGTPTTAGTFWFTVKVENSFGFDEKQLSITIHPSNQSNQNPPQPQSFSITTTWLPNGTVNQHYNQQLHASDFVTSWTRTSGSLPAGLSLSSTGTISGWPNRAGNYTFTIRAQGSGGSGSDTQTFTITITGGGAAGGNTSGPSGDVGGAIGGGLFGFFFVSMIVFVFVFHFVNAAKIRTFRTNAGRLKVGMTYNQAVQIMGRQPNEVVEVNKQFRWKKNLQRTKHSRGGQISVLILIDGNGIITAVDRNSNSRFIVKQAPNAAPAQPQDIFCCYCLLRNPPSNQRCDGCGARLTHTNVNK